ncbi:hypothetical protein PS1_036362 [Malus domestica]
MPEKDTVTWNTMISGYLRSGDVKRARLVFEEMPVRDIAPWSAMIIGYAQNGNHKRALLLFWSMHWEFNVGIGTTSVDMYAKCRCLKGARKVFVLMQDRSVVSWNALICGSAQRGFSRVALSLFEEMQQAGVRPNEVTFTGILRACKHKGLIEEGRKYFKLVDESGLEPTIQHYGCMVDLYGKAGLGPC